MQFSLVCIDIGFLFYIFNDDPSPFKYIFFRNFFVSFAVSFFFFFFHCIMIPIVNADIY